MLCYDQTQTQSNTNSSIAFIFERSIVITFTNASVRKCGSENNNESGKQGGLLLIHTERDVRKHIKFLRFIKTK